MPTALLTGRGVSLPQLSVYTNFDRDSAKNVRNDRLHAKVSPTTVVEVAHCVNRARQSLQYTWLTKKCRVHRGYISGGSAQRTKTPMPEGKHWHGFWMGYTHSNVLHNGVIEQGGPLVWRKEVEFTHPLCQTRGSSPFLPQAESTSHYSPLGGELCPTTAEVRPS